MWGEPRAGLGDAGRALGAAGDEGRFLGPGLQTEWETVLAGLGQPPWRQGGGPGTPAAVGPYLLSAAGRSRGCAAGSDCRFLRLRSRDRALRSLAFSRSFSFFSFFFCSSQGETETVSAPGARLVQEPHCVLQPPRHREVPTGGGTHR